VSALAAPAAAVDLNFSVGLGPQTFIATAVTAYAERVREESGGDINIRVFPLELVSLPEMGPGIRAGLTDIGYAALSYYPTEFAHTNFLGEQSMALKMMGAGIRDELAFAGAISEFIMTQCPECLDEFKQQEHVYMGSMSTAPYALLCNSAQIRQPADLKGKRLRAGAASNVRFAEYFGAVGLQLPANEVYEALSQGVLDCAIYSIPELTNLRLMEVVRSITLGVPGNVIGTTVAGNFNRTVWNSLTNEQRQILLRNTAYLAADMTWPYVELSDRDIAASRDLGSTIIEAGPELDGAMREFATADLNYVAELYASNYGVKRSAEIQQAFRPVLDRWVKLVENIDSAKALGDVYWNELYSKIDPAAYGVD
jgi:TRAP-type C4-dicarboxylate transport system substrate-binding protein